MIKKLIDATQIKFSISKILLNLGRKAKMYIGRDFLYRQLVNVFIMVEIKHMLINFLGNLKIIVETMNILLIEEQLNNLHAFEDDKTRFSVCLKKKPAFASVEKYVILYAIL